MDHSRLRSCMSLAASTREECMFPGAVGALEMKAAVHLLPQGGGASPPPALAKGEVTLLLDFDGTLVEIADTPEAVEVPRHVADLLDTLSSLIEGRLAVVSGRDVDWLASRLGLVGKLGQGGPVLVGNHGAELNEEAMPRPASLDIVAAALEDFAAKHPGVLVERKRFGVALHFRLAPEAEEASIALSAALAQEHGLSLQKGKAVAELRVPGRDKGFAVRTVMERAASAGTMPIFVGDDLTDEAGFSAAEELGGFGVVVGNRNPTAARYRLGTVAEVHAWLEQLCNRT